VLGLDDGKMKRQTHEPLGPREERGEFGSRATSKRGPSIAVTSLEILRAGEGSSDAMPSAQLEVKRKGNAYGNLPEKRVKRRRLRPDRGSCPLYPVRP